MQRAVGRILAVALSVALVGVASVRAAEENKELEVGKKAPEFKLKGVDDKEYSLKDALKKNDLVVVTFTCNTCPIAVAYQDRIIALQKDYKDKKVQVIAINSNSPDVQPGDSFEAMQKRAKEKEFNFPYVFDATQEVAKAYGAKVTPHIYLVNSDGVLVYRGAIDDNNNPKAAEKHFLRDAINAALSGKEIETVATKARGCTIKWKRG